MAVGASPCCSRSAAFNITASSGAGRASSLSSKWSMSASASVRLPWRGGFCAQQVSFRQMAVLYDGLCQQGHGVQFVVQGMFGLGRAVERSGMATVDLQGGLAIFVHARIILHHFIGTGHGQPYAIWSGSSSASFANMLRPSSACLSESKASAR